MDDETMKTKSYTHLTKYLEYYWCNLKNMLIDLRKNERLFGKSKRKRWCSILNEKHKDENSVAPSPHTIVYLIFPTTNICSANFKAKLILNKKPQLKQTQNYKEQHLGKSTIRKNPHVLYISRRYNLHHFHEDTYAAVCLVGISYTFVVLFSITYNFESTALEHSTLN